MALETGTYVADLNTANPTSTDPKSQGDDHLRLLKSVLKNTFAGFGGMVVVTGAEAQGGTANDYVVTVSPGPAAYTSSMLVVFKAAHTNTGAATLAINALAAKTLKALDGSALDASDIENGAVVIAFYDGTDFYLLSGNDRAARAGESYSGTHDFSGAVVVLPADVTIGNVSATEISYLDGVTSPLQAQINAKAAKAGDTYSGTHDFTSAVLRAATQITGDSTDKVATTAFVMAVAFAAILPGQAGNAGKHITTDGLNASWQRITVIDLFNLSAGVI